MIDGQLVEFLHHFSLRWKTSTKKYCLRTNQNIVIISYFYLKAFGLTPTIEIGIAFLKKRADGKQMCGKIQKIKAEWLNEQRRKLAQSWKY